MNDCKKAMELITEILWSVRKFETAATPDERDAGGNEYCASIAKLAKLADISQGDVEAYIYDITDYIMNY